MSGATEVAAAGREARRPAIAAMLRSQWRMIAAVSLRPRHEGDGFDAWIRLDPIIVRGSYEQQGFPGTPDASAKAEARRLDAIAACVDAVNVDLPTTEAIRSFRVVG
ncbi:MAG: hypothetical protein ACRDPE_00525 [Solirubrobacterales bacterium]